MDEARFKIADIVFSLACDDPIDGIDFRRPYRAFTTKETGVRPDFSIHLHFNGIPEGMADGSAKVFDSQTHWRLFEDDERTIVELTSAEEYSPYRVAVLTANLSRGDIFTATEADSAAGTLLSDRTLPDPLEYPLGELLMVLLLSRGRGLMVHACGVDLSGAGYLFAGNSTAGKSTIANLFGPVARVLNDDRIVVRKKDGRFWMYGTPWHGDCNRIEARGLPIQKLFFLSHGRHNDAWPEIGAKAASDILTRSFAPFWSPDGMAYTLDLCRRFVDSVPCFGLAFTPDHTVVDFVRCVK